MRPAPILDTSIDLLLTENGEVGAERIYHSLLTPWLIALQLAPGEALRDGQQGRGTGKRWVWVVRDQLSPDNWTRLNRVCRSVALQSTKLDPHL